MAVDETRRAEAETYIAAQPTREWVTHPMGENEPELRMAPAEVLHALPRADPCGNAPEPPPPPSSGALYETTAAAGLNVRVAPNTSAERVGSLPLGTQVRAVVHDVSWLRIVEGEHAGRYVASAYARPI
jgi:hypothetical protein